MDVSLLAWVAVVGAILVMLGRKRAKSVQGAERSMAALEATKATFRG